MHRLKPLILVCGALALAMVWLFVGDSLARKRSFAERTACVGTLTRLRLAKTLYADEHGLTNGAAIPDDLVWQLNDLVWQLNGVVEHCRSGGRYAINGVGMDPTCSFTGVVRWSGRLWRHELK